MLLVVKDAGSGDIRSVSPLKPDKPPRRAPHFDWTEGCVLILWKQWWKKEIKETHICQIAAVYTCGAKRARRQHNCHMSSRSITLLRGWRNT